MRTYEAQTAPVIDHYRALGRLKRWTASWQWMWSLPEFWLRLRA